MSAEEAAAPMQQPNKCSRCGCTDTPQWRRQGEQLVCNACGIKLARQLRRARQPGDGTEGDGQPGKAARTNGRGPRSAPDGGDAAGGRGRGRGSGGQQQLAQAQLQQVAEGQVHVGTPGGLMQLLAGGVAPANHGHPPTPHAWNIDNLLGSTFELWDFDLPHHPPGETPMAAAAVDNVFAAGSAAVGAGSLPLQQRQPLPSGAVPLALAHPVPVAGEAAGCHAVPAVLLPSGSVGQQWGPGQQHAAAVEQHHLDQLHLQRHHQLQVQLQEAEVSSSALAEEPASRPRPLPATGSNHSAAAEADGSGSRGAGVRTNSHYDPQQHCRQEVIAPPTAHPSPRQPARRGSGSLAGLSPNSDGRQPQGQPQQQQHAGGHPADGLEPSPRWEEYCPPQYQNDSGSVHQPATAPPQQQQQQQQGQYGSCGGHPAPPAVEPLLVMSQPEQGQQAHQQQHGSSFHRSSSQQTLMGSQQTLMARLPLSAALAPLPASLCHDPHCSDPRCCGGMAASLAAQQHGGSTAAAAPMAKQPSQQLTQQQYLQQQGQPGQQQQQGQQCHPQQSPPQEQWEQLQDRTPGVSLEGTRAALVHSSSCREARTSWHPPSQAPQQQQQQQSHHQLHPQPPQQQQQHLGGAQPPQRVGSAPPTLVRRTPSWESLTPQPYTLFGAEADGIPAALSRTLSAGSERVLRAAPHAAARLVGEPLPGRVVKTLATLPDVQLLYQSRPGPRGVVLHHVYPGLTCTLQLVRVGASSGSGSAGGRSPSEQSSGMIASGGGAGAESAGGAGGGGGAPGGERLTTRASLVNELSEVIVTFRDDVHPEEACVLPYMVRGCAAWDSGEGWLVLFEQFSQLHQFAGAIEQAARLVRGAS